MHFSKSPFLKHNTIQPPIDWLMAINPAADAAFFNRLRKWCSSIEKSITQNPRCKAIDYTSRYDLLYVETIFNPVSALPPHQLRHVTACKINDFPERQANTSNQPPQRQLHRNETTSGWECTAAEKGCSEKLIPRINLPSDGISSQNVTLNWQALFSRQAKWIQSRIKRIPLKVFAIDIFITHFPCNRPSHNSICLAKCWL